MSVKTLKVCFDKEIRRIRIIPSSVSELRSLIEERFQLPSNYSLTCKDEEGESVTIRTDDELREAIQFSAEDGRSTLRIEILSSEKKTLDSDSFERQADVHDTTSSNHDTSINYAFQNLIAAAATTALQAAGLSSPQVVPIIGSSQMSQAGEVADLSTQDTENSPAVVHRGVECDKCGMKPIVGIRYKCAVRDDFDVCESCEAADLNCEYPYLKIRQPSQAPACLITVLKEEGSEDGPEDLAAAKELEAKLRSGTATFGDLRRGGRPWLRQNRCGARGRRWGGGRHNANRPWHGRRMAKNFAGQNHQQENSIPHPDNSVAHEQTEQKLTESELQHEEELQMAIRRSLEDPTTFKPQEGESKVSELPPPPTYASATTHNPEEVLQSRVVMEKKKDALLPPKRGKTQKSVQKPMARFISDVTIPDGTEVLPGTTFVKVWKMRNDGDIVFPGGSKLKNVGGDLMDGPSHVDVNCIAPDEEFEVTLELTAPQKSGRYIGYWRLQTADEMNFGHRLWVDVRVTEDNQTFSTSGLDWALLSASGSIITDEQDARLTKADERKDKKEAQESAKEGTSEQTDVSNVAIESNDQPNVMESNAELDQPSDDSNDQVSSVEPEQADDGKWEKEIGMLAEMGFYERSKIIPALEKHCTNPLDQGNMDRVIEELLL